MKRVFQFTSALLAGAVALSLAACTAPDAGEPAGGSTGGTAAQTDAPQGRWVEQQAEGIPRNVAISGAPVVLNDGSLLLYVRDNMTGTAVRLISTDNGATWQSETPDWAEQVGGNFSRWAVRSDGTLVFLTHEENSADPTDRAVRFWLVQPDGALSELPLSGELTDLYAVSDLCFLPDGTLAVVPISFTEGAMQGDLLLYDVANQQVKSWASVAASGQGTVAGTSRVVSMVPAADADGTAFLYVLSDGGDLYRIDTNGTVIPQKSGFTDAPYSTKIALDSDSAICYANNTGIYRQVLGGGLTEQIVDGAGTSLSLSSNYTTALAVAPDGSYLAVLHGNAMESFVCRYVFDETLSAPTETLNVWSLNENATVRAAIQSFALSHPEYSVEYEAALGGDASLTSDDALRTLNTELLAGDGPDVLILDGADLDAFADSGLLADLSGAVDTGALLDFVAEDYVQGNGSIPMLPARFSIPVMVGQAGTLDGVSTLDDVLALVQQHAPRPAENNWVSLEPDQRYALGFSSIYELTEFVLQTSQPAVLQNSTLDEATLRQLMEFITGVGEAYGMDRYPSDTDGYGITISGPGVDAISWSGPMCEYIQVERAVYGCDDITTPAWLSVTSPDDYAGSQTDFSGSGQVILQPGLCPGVYKPSCFVAVNSGSSQPDAAMDFAAALFGDDVQGEFLEDGLPVTQAGIDRFVERNQSVAGGDTFAALLGQLSTPVVLNRALLSEIGYYANEVVAGSLTLDEAVAGVQDELALYFAERQ